MKVMAYIDNPYNSEEGKSLLKENLTNIFMPTEDGKGLESTSKRMMVDNFRSNTNRIIGLMKRFAKGYKQIPLSDAYDSGVLICPHCQRRDFQQYWETVDLSIYDPKHWIGSVKPTKATSGPMWSKSRVQVMHRVRCNHVTTCNKCHQTYQGHAYTECPNPSCNADADRLAKVGCLKESVQMGYVQEKTLAQQYPTDERIAGRFGNINKEINVYRNGRLVPKSGKEAAFELLTPVSGPANGPVNNPLSVGRHIPILRMTYEADGRTTSPNYPISQMRYAFSRNKRRVCTGRITYDQYGRPRNAHDGNGYSYGDTRVWLVDEQGREQHKCKVCGSAEPPIVKESKAYAEPKPLVIENMQPLPQSDIMTSHNGGPVWQIYISDPSDRRERSNFLVPVPQVWTLKAIPTEVEVSEAGLMQSSCPNDVGFGNAVKAINDVEGEQTATVKDYLSLPRAKIVAMSISSKQAYDTAKSQNKLPQVLANKWQDYVVCIVNESGDEITVSGITPAKDGTIDWRLKLQRSDLEFFSTGLGESGPNFTYAVCEGRSRAAFKWNGQWVDVSPQCKSYRAQDGSVLSSPRYYPRFNQYPTWYADVMNDVDEEGNLVILERTRSKYVQNQNYQPPDPNGFSLDKDYLWMEEMSHIIMDPNRYGPLIEGKVEALQTYHTVKAIAEELDLNIGQRTIVNECQTCKSAYRAGGIEISRKNEGYVNDQGIVKSPFIYPQEVYDLEVKYQSEFGMNALNKPLAWGVEAKGKQLLQDPDKIRVE